MKFLKSLFVAFLFLFISLKSSAGASESIDLSTCQLIKTSMNQMLISDTGMYVLDAETTDLVLVDGFIYLENEVFAVKILDIPMPNMELTCGHYYGCTKCMGCNKEGCAFYCPGCKKK